jgi:hypothetical protein
MGKKKKKKILRRRALQTLFCERSFDGLLERAVRLRSD